MLPSAAELVAHYLRQCGYTETLESFVREAGLPPDIGANSRDSVTIETILQEKKAFDTSLNFEKLGFDDKNSGWTLHAPSKPIVLSSLPSRSNILSVAVFELLLPSATETRTYVAVTTADRKLHLLNSSSPTLELAHSYSSFQDSPILDIIAIGPQYLLVASMSGKVLLYDTVKDEVLEERRDHSKYVVKLASCPEGNTIWIASAGWDAKVFLYKVQCAGNNLVQLGEPMAVLGLPSIPETLVFVSSPDDGTPILLVARRDSTFLHYYAIPHSGPSAMTYLGKQNLAPHSNSWIAFTPSDVQLCPTDPSLVAVATSTTPHMKLMVVKLLIPTQESSLLEINPVLGSDRTITQAFQASAELLIQNREEAAILISVSTLAPQTPYSTPRLVWRPDGSGVYVSSDDGIVRGIEATTGKLVSTLEAHDPGSKLRCLWAGHLNKRHDSSFNPSLDQEYLISGGFDQKLIAWTP